MKRSRSVSRIQADMPLIEAIMAIKGDLLCGAIVECGHICDIDRALS